MDEKIIVGEKKYILQTLNSAFNSCFKVSLYQAPSLAASEMKLETFQHVLTIAY